MTDIFGVLDAAIEQFGRKEQCVRGTSRDLDAAGTVAGTANILKTGRVPVTPAVLVANRESLAEELIGSKNDNEPAIGRGVIAPELYPLQNTGSTGITGTREVSCGFPSPRAD